MGSSSLPIGYYALHIFSFVANSALTLTLVFGFKHPGVLKPSPLLPANTSTYSLFGIVACLLLFTGHVHGPEPPKVLCQAQSALMLAFPPALSGLALSLVLTVWRLAWLVHHERTPWFTDTQFNSISIAFPYLFFVAFAVAGSIVGTQSPVTRHDFYCMTDNKTLTLLNAVATLVILATTVLFQVWTLFIVFKRYRISRKFGRAEVGSDVALFIRVLSFGLFVFFAIVLSGIALVNYSSPIPDILVALFGPVVFFIFASQDEVLRCWKLKPPRSIVTDRSDSVATLNSARAPRSRPRDSNTFSFISAPNPVSDLHSYRFPPPSPTTPTA